ncbi:MAG: twin-arginine translocation pathway signal protein, partial [Haliea sp.]
MDRRDFLRVAGGGYVLAATASTAGCSAQMPASAIAAWSGPPQETDDVRRWILGYAILAPHSHNLQSWVVDLATPGQIVLRCDLERLLPETDPFSRQIMMSHGTFLELLDMAARERGLRADIKLFPEGVFGPDKPDRRPVARIRLTPDPGVGKDPLFKQILLRRTNRSLYESRREVPAQAWADMALAVKPYPLRLGFVSLDQPALLARHRAIAAEAWRIELTTPRTVLESYKVLRVGADEVEKSPDGLCILDPTVVMLNRLGLFDR